MDQVGVYDACLQQSLGDVVKRARRLGIDVSRVKSMAKNVDARRTWLCEQITRTEARLRRAALSDTERQLLDDALEKTIRKLGAIDTADMAEQQFLDDAIEETLRKLGITYATNVNLFGSIYEKLPYQEKETVAFNLISDLLDRGANPNSLTNLSVLSVFGGPVVYRPIVYCGSTRASMFVLGLVLYADGYFNVKRYLQVMVRHGASLFDYGPGLIGRPYAIVYTMLSSPFKKENLMSSLERMDTSSIVFLICETERQSQNSATLRAAWDDQKQLLWSEYFSGGGFKQGVFEGLQLVGMQRATQELTTRFLALRASNPELPRSVAVSIVLSSMLRDCQSNMNTRLFTCGNGAEIAIPTLEVLSLARVLGIREPMDQLCWWSMDDYCTLLRRRVRELRDPRVTQPLTTAPPVPVKKPSLPYEPLYSAYMPHNLPALSPQEYRERVLRPTQRYTRRDSDEEVTETSPRSYETTAEPTPETLEEITPSPASPATIIREQDEAYEASLTQDRMRDARRREQERALADLDGHLARATRRWQEAQRAGGDIDLVILLPDGNARVRVDQRDPASLLFDYVDVRLETNGGYRFVLPSSSTTRVVITREDVRDGVMLRDLGVQSGRVAFERM